MILNLFCDRRENPDPEMDQKLNYRHRYEILFLLLQVILWAFIFMQSMLKVLLEQMKAKRGNIKNTESDADFKKVAKKVTQTKKVWGRKLLHTLLKVNNSTFLLIISSMIFLTFFTSFKMSINFGLSKCLYPVLCVDGFWTRDNACIVSMICYNIPKNLIIIFPVNQRIFSSFWFSVKLNVSIPRDQLESLSLSL